MADTKKAVFQLNRFIIPKFTFDEPSSDFKTIDIKLNPSGIYNTSNGEYQLVLVFMAYAMNEDSKEDTKLVISATLKAFYTLNDKPSAEEIPDFFYQNGLAIIFPYLRSFVSTLTLQSGTNLLILPLLNLTNLSITLKDNTQVFM